MVMGVVYVVVFGLPARSHNKPLTVSGKISSIRTLLDETYLIGNSLAGFDQNNQVTYSSLGSLQSRLQTDNDALKKALEHAPGELGQNLGDQIETVVSRQDAAIKTMDRRYTLLLKTIEYDPAADLGRLDAAKDTEKLSERAVAARDSLKKTAEDTTPISTNSKLSVEGNSGTPLLFNSVTRDMLQAEADCLGKIADQLAAKHYPEASTTGESCIAGYPKVRRQAVENVLQSVTDKDYRQYLKTTVPPLLRQLDALIKQTL